MMQVLLGERSSPENGLIANTPPPARAFRAPNVLQRALTKAQENANVGLRKPVKKEIPQ